MGHGKLFVASGLRRRVSRPHHICDTKLPDGAIELLRLEGAWPGPRSFRRESPPDRDERGAADLPARRVAGVGKESSEGGAGFRQPLWSTWLEAEQSLKWNWALAHHGGYR